MKSKILELFGLAAKDKSPEEIARMALDAASAMDETPPEGEGGEEVKDGDYKEKLFESIDDEALDGLIEKIMAKMAAKKAAEEVDGDPLEKTIAALTGGEEAHTVPAEEMDKKDCGAMDSALAAGILKAMQPTVAAIKDEKQRNAVADALIKCVTAKDSASDIAKIMQAAQKNAQHVADKRPDPQKIIDETQAAYDALNPHKAKKEA